MVRQCGADLQDVGRRARTHWTATIARAASVAGRLPHARVLLVSTADFGHNRR